jgi:adenylate cyclase
MIEIERKFLVNKDLLMDELIYTPHRSYEIYQYYIDERTRLRFITHSDSSKKAFITVKDGTSNLERSEWEFEVSYEKAMKMYNSLFMDKKGLGYIRKTRHIMPYDPDINWEIDIFHDDNGGLILAEIELPSTDFPLSLIPLFGQEVTGVERYYNANLAKNPYFKWRYKQENG